MYSKTEEEIMRKRGKSQPSHLNIYHKMALFVGALILLWTRWTSLIEASIISVGISGTILLGFFLLKYHKRRKEGKKDDLEEIPLKSEEKVIDHQEIIAKAGECAVDFQTIFPEQKKEVDFEEGLPGGQEKVFKLQEIFPNNEEKAIDQQNIPAENKCVGIERTLLKLEEKAADLHEILTKLEEKAVDIEKIFLKLGEKADDRDDMIHECEGKVDLQMMLSGMQKKDEKTPKRNEYCEEPKEIQPAGSSPLSH